MKKNFIGIAIAVFAAGVMSSSAVVAAEEDPAAVRAAVSEFYSALNAMFTGELAPMKKIWSHKDDVTYMGPAGGFRLGWEQVLSDWEQQAALKLGGEVEPKDMQIIVGSDLAVVSNYEVGNNVAADGKAEKVTIRATSLFRNESGAWKVIGHHTDMLPFLQK